MLNKEVSLIGQHTTEGKGKNRQHQPITDGLLTQAGCVAAKIEFRDRIEISLASIQPDGRLVAHAPFWTFKLKGH